MLLFALLVSSHVPTIDYDLEEFAKGGSNDESLY